MEPGGSRCCTTGMGGMKRAPFLVLVAALVGAGSAVGAAAPTPVLRFEPTTAVAGQFVSV